MKALVVLSGGQDSTTCLFWALRECGGHNVGAVSFDYGQRHAVELESAAAVAEAAGVAHSVVPIRGIFSGASPLTDLSRQVGQYENADVLPGGLEATFVPGRNIVFLAAAAGLASAWGYDAIVTGVSAEDNGGYPDCRPEFVQAMQTAVNMGLPFPVAIFTPLLHLSKRATVELAAELPGCLEALALSHTCYRGERPACGKCHACLLRLRGFEEAGVRDPIEYVTR